jgi:hypothetical protein
MRPSQLHVLLFVLVLAAFKSTLGLCNLCLDGSTITKPDYFIGITKPLVINTCKDLSDALWPIDSEPVLCGYEQQLSAICGCPIAEDACSICEGSQNITKPQQPLDGLVDHPLAFLSANDIAVTCAFYESYMQVYNTEHSQCLFCQTDDLRRYCGCLTEEEEENNECTLCPGGEIVLDQSGVDMFINIGNDDMITCEQAKTLVAKTYKGTEVCNQIQRVSTRCGCPIPENACRLCRNRRSVTKASKNITTPSGERVSCKSFEAQLHNFESSSINCTSLNDTSLDESYAEQCGCLEAEAFVPCSLCVGGEAVPFPEKETAGLIDFGANSACGSTASAAILFHENSQGCKWVRLSSKLCGCKPRSENTCTLCGGGDIMSNPFQEVVFTFGATNDIYPEDFDEAFRFFSIERKSTCEFAESVFSSFYTQCCKECFRKGLPNRLGIGSTDSC